MARKYCMVIVDGMADLPHARTKNMTPLEVARTPTLDALAAQGRIGLVKTVPAGGPADSLGSTVSLLGFDPQHHNPDQAICEANTLGIPVAQDEWLWCCDLVSTFDGMLEDPRAGNIRQHEAEVLIQELARSWADRGVRFHVGKGNHHFLSCRGTFSKETSHNPYDMRGQSLREHYPQGEGSGLLTEIMEQAHQLLQEHEINKLRRELRENPADAIWLWGGGQKVLLPTFHEVHKLSAAIVSASPEIQGFAKAVDMQVVPNTTSSLGGNYASDVENVLQALQQVDLVCLHLDTLIEVSRYGEVGQKVRLLEQMDDKVIAVLHKRLPADSRLLVVGGHFLSIQERRGSTRPVPFLIYGKDMKNGSGLSFHERHAQQANCLLSHGQDLLQLAKM
jgi:2,3-bisphosphoglycerate-independent phosphoglycerate mutase